jgi:hypothetical protein
VAAFKILFGCRRTSTHGTTGKCHFLILKRRLVGKGDYMTLIIPIFPPPLEFI